MRGLSGIMTLVVLVLLFTMTLSVSGSELLNETSDFGFLMENKTIEQVGMVVLISVEGVVSVFSDNLERASFSSSNTYNNKVFGDSIWTVKGTINISTYLLDFLPSGITEAAHTGFEVDNLLINNINELRGGTWHTAGRYKQLLFT